MTGNQHDSPEARTLDARTGRYSRELKEEAVRRVVEERESVAQVCRALKIKPGSLYFALRKFEALERSD